MEDPFLEVWLFAEDDVVVVTWNGEFYKGFAHSMKELRAHADIVHEFMIGAMKNPKCKVGLWEWKIKNNWTSLDGMQIAI